MPSIFKALASISAWVLFVNGAGSVVWSAVTPLVRKSEGEAYNDVLWAIFGVLTLFLSVIVMKIRKGLE